MSDDKDPRMSLSQRLLSRSGGGVSRRQMSDGGEVYAGPTVQRALKAVNARAFTMDEDIFVDEDFDESSPEDAALYAHEAHHQAHSGGDEHGHGSKGAEESAARAIERMVLHRAEAGEDMGQVLRDAKTNAPADTSAADKMVSEALEQKHGGDTPEAAYAAMLSQGKTHEEIVRELAEFVVKSLSEREESDQFRSTTSDWFS